MGKTLLILCFFCYHEAMYEALDTRYDFMKYRRVGNSGLVLSAFTLGLWHNFGSSGDYAEMKRMVYTAFDNGIMSFDLANNYGPPGGEAERNFGSILKDGLSAYRDEIIISTKAGYQMWPGPLGRGGGKKHLLSSLDQSLKRMGLDYVDIFYHHCPDPDTPLEETVEALVEAIRSGKTRYVALSKYNAKDARRAYELFSMYGVRPVLDQVRYSILDRAFDDDNLFMVLDSIGMGSAIFSPLAQGLLTDKYLSGDVPVNSRAHENNYLRESVITAGLIARLEELKKIASMRGQSLAQMALAFALSQRSVATVLVGARNAEQLVENIKTLETDLNFSDDEIAEILSYA